MDVINEILSEEETMSMPEETLIAFSRVCNTDMKFQLASYLDNVDGLEEVKNKISKCIGDDVHRSTFHFKVKDEDIQALLRKANLKSLPVLAYNKEIDLDTLISKLEWLEDNEGSIRSELPTREKDDYKVAYEMICNFQRNPIYHHDHNIAELMRVFKDRLFCPPREKSTQTGIRSLSINKNFWKMQLKAAKYLKYCIDNNISYANAREC